MERERSILMNITRGKIPKAQKVVLYGVEGIGKSTFASQFPDPLFIDTEDSTMHMDVNRFDKPTSWVMLQEQIKYVKQNKPCRTLVIDTMDWAEQLCKKHLMAQNKWNDSGNDYGNKYVALEKEMGGLLNQLSEVIDAGINVVVTAHAMLRKKEEPDEMGAFDRYELKLEKKSSGIVKEWADMVLFANYKTTVITDGKTKKATGGERVMYTTHRPAWDAKNRVGLSDELPFAYSQIEQAFISATEPVQQAQKQTDPMPFDKPQQQASVPEPEPNFGPERDETIPSVIPQALADLMRMDHVSTDEIMQIIYQGGFMPQDTPLENVPTGLWEHLSTNWSAAMGLLNKQIRNF